jgi:hypothetical protein
MKPCHTAAAFAGRRRSRGGGGGVVAAHDRSVDLGFGRAPSRRFKYKRNSSETRNDDEDDGRLPRRARLRSARATR